jgi:hypothetical protein
MQSKDRFVRQQESKVKRTCHQEYSTEHACRFWSFPPTGSLSQGTIAIYRDPASQPVSSCCTSYARLHARARKSREEFMKGLSTCRMIVHLNLAREQSRFRCQDLSWISLKLCLCPSTYQDERGRGADFSRSVMHPKQTTMAWRIWRIAETIAMPACVSSVILVGSSWVRDICLYNCSNWRATVLHCNVAMSKKSTSQGQESRKCHFLLLDCGFEQCLKFIVGPATCCFLVFLVFSGLVQKWIWVYMIKIRQAGTLESKWCVLYVYCFVWMKCTNTTYSFSCVRHGVCSSTRECRKKGRLETSPLFSCILLMPSNDDVTHFHTATNITSREWLKVLASYFCPSSYVRMSSLVGTSSEDALAKTYARTATVTMAREESKGCHQIRWADCLWNMHMIRVNHGWCCWIPFFFFSAIYLPLVSREIVLTMSSRQALLY